MKNRVKNLINLTEALEYERENGVETIFEER